MPFVRISLLKSKSPDYLRALSDSIHRAMVETFNVPPADRFQMIHQHEPGELIFDRTYLGGPRSDDFVLFAITAGKPRTTDTRKAFLQARGRTAGSVTRSAARGCNDRHHLHIAGGVIVQQWRSLDDRTGLGNPCDGRHPVKVRTGNAVFAACENTGTVPRPTTALSIGRNRWR